MSYILDALKKSEQEREQGSVPHLQSNHATGAHVPQKSPLGIYAAIISVLLVTIIIMSWVIYQKKSQPEMVTAGPEPAVTEKPANLALAEQPGKPVRPVKAAQPKTPVKKPEQPQTQSTPATKPKSSARPAVKPASTAKPKTREVQPEGQTAKPKPGNARPEEASSPNVVFLQEEIADEELYSREPLDVSGKPQRSPATETVKPEDTAPMDKSEDISVASRKPARPAPPTRRSATEKPTIYDIADLPGNIRSAIPSITFSGHVYNSEPARRSVILNGKKMREGEFLNDDIKLQEISAKGAVLRYKDTWFRLGALQDWGR